MRSAPHSGRRVGVAGVVSTTAISLTAAICGVSVPAAADPLDDFSSPSTTVSAPEPDFEMPQMEMPTFEMPSFEPPAPVQQAPVEQAPVEQAPVEAPAPVEPEPVQEVPAPVEPEAPSPTPEPEPEPEPTPEPTPVAPTPSDTRAPAPAPDAESTPESTPSAPSAPSETSTVATTDVSLPPSSESVTAPESEPAPESESESEPTEPSRVTSVAVEPKAVPEARPDSLTAPEADVQLAQTAPPVEVKPQPAPITEVNDFRQQVTSLTTNNVTTNNTVINQNNTVVNNNTTVVRSNIVQYNTQWVQYDAYYRPRICNPYRDPLRVVYYYDGAPRVSIIPPLGNIVVEAAAVGAYNFTAMVLNAAGVPTNVAVGSFFGGGYFPGPGMPPPPPPPRLVRYDNVPVQVRYASATYRPFRVQRVIDAGYDRVVGQRKVLLDGVTPAWGDWKQNAAGERQFEINQTQQFPGLDSPAQVPLPGDYPLELVNDSASGLSLRDKLLIGLAGTLGTLALAAVGLTVYLNRRRPRI